VFTVLGSSWMYDTAFDYDGKREDRDGAYLTAAFFGVFGAAMLIGGGRAWWSSREALGRTDPRPGAQPPVVPLAP
jgi:hypothetical protein